MDDSFYYVRLKIFIAVEKISCRHAFLACQLELKNLEEFTSLGCDIQASVVDDDGAGSSLCGFLRQCRLVYLQDGLPAVGITEGCPRCRHRTKASDEMIDTLCGLVPAYLASLLEYLRSSMQLASGSDQLFLGY